MHEVVGLSRCSRLVLTQSMFFFGRTNAGAGKPRTFWQLRRNLVQSVKFKSAGTGMTAVLAAKINLKNNAFPKLTFCRALQSLPS